MRTALLILVSMLAALAQAPPPPKPAEPEVKPQDKCTVEGRVVNATTREPLRKASISMHRADPTAQMQGAGTTTDATGNFAMKDIDPGSYSLMASRNGFVVQQYGAKRTGYQSAAALLTLAPAQKMTGILFKLVPQSVVTGRVVDADSEPIANAQVQLMQPRYQQGKKELAPAGFGQTNDLGEYRIFGVGPGRYFLNVSYPQNQNFGTSDKSANAAPQEGYRPVYYPGVADIASAAALDVPAGGELRGINLTMQPSRAVRVRGKVTGLPEGQFAMAMLTPRTPASRGFMAPQMNAVNQKDGSFEIKGVTTGSYYLTVSVMSSQKENLMARLPLEVGRDDVDGANLALAKGTDVKGLLKVDGGEYDLSTVHVSVDPVEVNMMGSGYANANVKADGTFTLEAMHPQNVNVRVSGLKPGAYVKTIRVGDQEAEEVADMGAAAAGGLEITLSLNGASVEGVVNGPGPKPPVGATVVLAPESEHASDQRWYGVSTTDQDGHYKIETVRPGKYTLYAFEDIEPGSYMEPGFFKPFGKYAKEVELKEKQHTTLQPELIPVTAMDRSQ